MLPLDPNNMVHGFGHYPAEKSLKSKLSLNKVLMSSHLKLEPIMPIIFEPNSMPFHNIYPQET
ncbi:hypothetical protein BB560_005126 [Smittium megazygosporum]|uniref:Uncharacterized protein n=1 Tax=Smittium megazygosporum TaxID=133381 RepID=A0A2T9Z7C7_9FUNG|nr:hypothetical protein BB560_005126 [Smittium megazygosporum]